MLEANILRAALIADSLSLQSHWIYNQSKIARLYPEGAHQFGAPETNYHPGKTAGDFTHYGDQIQLALRSYQVHGKWNLTLYSAAFLNFWDDNNRFVDKATKATLAHLTDGQPASDSNDTAGASRALLTASLRSKAPEDQQIQDVRAMCALTHGDPETIDSAEYLTRALIAIRSGQPIADALQHAAQASYQSLDALAYLKQAKDALSNDNYTKVAADFGLTCHHPEAFPLILHTLLRYPDQPEQGLSQNTLAGGDNAARAIALAALYTAAHGWSEQNEQLWTQINDQRELDQLLAPHSSPLPARKSMSFDNGEGQTLKASLELPAERPLATAIFAHCFTCGQSSRAARQLSSELASRGIATLRFDFTGIGSSEGDFGATSFLTNVRDLIAAAEHLSEQHSAPTFLIGHSLGGAAVLAAAHQLPSIKGVATIGAPSDPGHVTHLFEDHLEEIKQNGEAQVKLAGRSFKISKRFLEDIEAHCQPDAIAKLKRDLLILHSPTDQIVGIDNAAQLYSRAKHPKSFISLPNTDHLLLQGGSEEVAEFISAWAKRVLNNSK